MALELRPDSDEAECCGRGVAAALDVTRCLRNACFQDIHPERSRVERDVRLCLGQQVLDLCGVPFARFKEYFPELDVYLAGRTAQAGRDGQRLPILGFRLSKVTPVSERVAEAFMGERNLRPRIDMLIDDAPQQCRRTS